MVKEQTFQDHQMVYEKGDSQILNQMIHPVQEAFLDEGIYRPSPREPLSPLFVRFETRACYIAQASPELKVLGKC